ncbi:MAG: hypothetical protein ACO27Q_06875 [Bacteroidia bacterium]
MMTKQDKIAIVFGMNGHFYDAIMNRCPAWVWTDADFDDWFFAELGI